MKSYFAAVLSCFALVSAPAHAQMSDGSAPRLFDDFSTLNTSVWTVATWENGYPFDCKFSSNLARAEGGSLFLRFNATTSPKECAEVRTRNAWQYGRFLVQMAAPSVPGMISSFFLYTGRSGSRSHFEIDIELVGEEPTIHTNFWVAGVPKEQKVNLPAGLDRTQMNTYSITWTPNSIVWHVWNKGAWHELRSETNVKISARMQLMMNVWLTNPRANFGGEYKDQPLEAAAEYQAVSIYGLK